MTPDRQRAIQDRAGKHAIANEQARLEALKGALEQKRAGWNATPIATARIYAELWPLIMNEDWILASPTGFSGGAQQRSSGITTNRTVIWAHRAPGAWGTARRRRWAPHWPQRAADRW